MSSHPERIKSLADALSTLWTREQAASHAHLDELDAAARALLGDTADRRCIVLLAKLEKLRRQLSGLFESAGADLLRKLGSEAEGLRSSWDAVRAAAFLRQVLEDGSGSQCNPARILLDAALELTKAERGFVVRYTPESSAVDVQFARDFESNNLSVEEYGYSRNLLRKVLLTGTPLLVGDALEDPAHSQHESVRDLGLRSILVVPLTDERLVIGAVYLEDRRAAWRFRREDLELLLLGALATVVRLRSTDRLAWGQAALEPLFLDAEGPQQEIVGSTPATTALRDEIRRVAPSDATVLIEGETGTGKELVAQALHALSRRGDGPFVALNCAAIPESLVEAELFGHEKGAFTGATSSRKGQVELAACGTLFLDEINELPYGMQSKLLRFLQSGEYRRVGGSGVLRSDVRVLAATSRDLKQMMREHKFQDALYYRLFVVPLNVPALRDRRADIPALVQHFVRRYAARYGRPVTLAPGVVERLVAYDFPGNVRELENLAHRLVVRCVAGRVDLADLPPEVRGAAAPAGSDILGSEPLDIQDLSARRESVRRILAAQERRLVERVVRECGGNTSEAARRLGLHRATLHKIRGRVADEAEPGQ
jgi:transcriptional regulator with GAF, ATPase, and Fis domain